MGSRRFFRAFLPALVILVPAVTLAALGLRAYKAEQVLSENRFERSLQSIADLMASGLEQSAQSALRDLVDLARAATLSDVDVERVRLRHPLIGQVFVIDRQGEFVYPNLSGAAVAPPAAAPTLPPPPQRADSPASLYQLVAVYHQRLRREQEAQRLLAGAGQAEREGRWAAAQEAFAGVLERSARFTAAAQLGLARSALSGAAWERAAQAFAVLVQRHGSQVDWSGTGYALLGRIGLTLTAERCAREAPARPAGAPAPPKAAGCPTGLPDLATAAFQLYSDLVHARLPAPPPPRARIYYVDWARQRIPTPAPGPRVATLAELDRSAALLRVGLAFASGFGPEGIREIQRSAGFRPRAVRIPAVQGGRVALVMQSLGDRVVGFLLDEAALHRTLAGHQARRQLPEGFSVRLQRARPGAPRPRPAPRLVRALGEVLGDFTLAFIGPRTGPRRLQDRPESRYLALAAGLVFMLLAGLLILYRGVRQERELARLQSDFVSNVSHELKTPLTSIRMFGEMLQQDLAAEPAQRTKYYGIIVAESERLGRLISNVLDFSRMERGTRTYAVEAQPLVDLVRDAVDTFRNFREAEGFDLRVEADAGPEVLVDRDAVLQSIINLLTNAVKYSGPRREVEVRVQTRAGAALVAVRDWGIGIPRAEQRRVFEDFYRASNVRKGGTEGTGLGLALVRRHAQNMGGSVEVESVEGQGSTFRLVLPLAP